MSLIIPPTSFNFNLNNDYHVNTFFLKALTRNKLILGIKSQKSGAAHA